MKYLIISTIFISLWAQFNKIETTNQLKLEAENAYQSKNYKKAVLIYQRLITEYEMEDESIRLNLANALFLGNENKKSVAEYQLLTNSSNSKTRSIAYQQLGIISALRGKYQAAILEFKQALKIDPENENARYNYELVKKIHNQEISQSQSRLTKDPKGNEKDKGEAESGKQQTKEELLKKINSSGNRETSYDENTHEGDLRNRSDSGDESRDKEKDPLSNEEEKELDAGEKGNKEKEALKVRRLNELKISEEKARMILEVLKNEEIQYIQQRRRTESNKEYINKPDW